VECVFLSITPSSVVALARFGSEMLLHGCCSFIGVSRSGTAFGYFLSFGVPHRPNYPPRAGHIPARADPSLDISQRVNLVERTALDEGYLPLLDVTPDNAPVGPPRKTLIDRLNADLMDVAFVDEPIQCDPEICEIVKETYAYKGRKDWNAGNQ
jgi:hypothetical protein